MEFRSPAVEMLCGLWAETLKFLAQSLLKDREGKSKGQGSRKRWRGRGGGEEKTNRNMKRRDEKE